MTRNKVKIKKPLEELWIDESVSYDIYQITNMLKQACNKWSDPYQVVFYAIKRGLLKTDWRKRLLEFWHKKYLVKGSDVIKFIDMIVYKVYW